MSAIEDGPDNASFISSDSTGEMCMICFTELHSMHELACCDKLICTVCVTNWINKQPIKDSLCVFCKKPNYIFQHSYIDLDDYEESGCYSHVFTCIMICSISVLCAGVVYIFTFGM